MRAFAWLRSRPRAVASASSATAGVLAITTMAFVYEGFPTTEVDLHDGGVWVTKQSSLLVGHFNHESQVLDGGLRTTTDDYDVLQSGDDRHGRSDDADSTVTTIDPAMVALTESADVPGGREGRAGRPDARDPRPRVGSTLGRARGGLGSFEVEGTDPPPSSARAADVTVGVDGTVLRRLARERRARHDRGRRRGRARRPDHERDSTGSTSGDEATITAVGRRAVVLDAATRSLISSDGLRTEVDGGRRRPCCSSRPPRRMPSPSRPPAALVRVPFDGSEPAVAEAGGQGAPAAPVYLEGLRLRGVVGIGEVRARLRRRSDDDLATDIERRRRRHPSCSSA